MKTRFEPWYDPINLGIFWSNLKNWMLHPEKTEEEMGLGRLSKLTRLAFLLDPFATLVWPHPRKQPFPTIGSIVSGWIVRMKNPRLESKLIPGLETSGNYLFGRRFNSVTEEVSILETEWKWRFQMFRLHGDKWPKGVTEWLHDPTAYM